MSQDKKIHSRFAVARGFLIFWTLFIGIGAVAGAVCMLIDPSGRLMGMDAMMPYFKKLPFSDILFSDLTFAGISLLIVNGLTNLAAAGFLIANKKPGAALGGIFGITLMLWICIQFYFLPANFMSTSYFFFGLAQAATGWATVVFERQEKFHVELSDYKNVGTDKKRLVVYFSRMGYVKQKALEEADRTGAKIYEIKPTELTAGTLGFWWCGRYGMHRWAMPIEEIPDLSSYEHVTICSPIWVFTLAAPTRAFCKAAAGKISEADYILVHHTRQRYESAADEMDSLLGIKRTRLRSFVCREGKFTEI